MDIDLCKNVYCKAHQRCVVKSREVAFCVNKKKKIVKNDLNHGPGKERKKSNQFKLNSINRNKLANCKQCPVTKPDFVCGDDNSTYSSICRLNFHNCVHQTQIKAICRGFCPCKRVKNFQGLLLFFLFVRFALIYYINRKAKRVKNSSKMGKIFQQNERREIG